MEKFSTRDAIVEVVNKLFVYTDERHWDKLQSEVFTEKVDFDMSSAGGEKAVVTSKHICEAWQTGFTGIDAVNHLAGNYLVSIQEKTASVFAYATATHYKKSATQGTTRDMVGTYDIRLTEGSSGWRIDLFKYNLKYITGNMALK